MTDLNFDLLIKAKYRDGYIEHLYNEYDNAYYLGNIENPYLILLEAKGTFITSCVINEKTVVICDCAFEYCSGLKSVTIPNSVTSIGSYAFSGCNNLKTVSVPSKNLIDDTTLGGCNKNLEIIDRSEI